MLLLFPLIAHETGDLRSLRLKHPNGATLIIIFLLAAVAAVVAAFVRHNEAVLGALLDERDLERQRILRDVTSGMPEER